MTVQSGIFRWWERVRRERRTTYNRGQWNIGPGKNTVKTCFHGVCNSEKVLTMFWIVTIVELSSKNVLTVKLRPQRSVHLRCLEAFGAA
jgi:hypothetical protein